MSTYHKVKRGEHLSEILTLYGFSNYRTIWDDPKNAALKTRRIDPRKIIPGDKIFIPEKNISKLPAETAHLHRFRVISDPLNPLRRQAHVLEVHDIHFHHDSAVLLPDYDPNGSEEQKPFGFDAFRTCHIHAQNHPEQKILIPGHADTSGAADYNVGLSRMRAESVFHFLLGHRDHWIELSLGKHKVEDSQLILKWIDAMWNWGCDPGLVDNIEGPQTTSSVRAFQQQYNYHFDASITIDGKVGKQTWGAFFDVYTEVLAASLDTDRPGLAKYRGDLRFIDYAQKTVGCGEHWPIEEPLRDNYRSSTNRRVEILFISQGDEPTMECHPSSSSCIPEKCELYDPKRFDFLIIPVLVKGGPAHTTLVVMIAREPEAKPRLLIADKSNTAVRTLGEEDGERHGSTLVFHIDPATLPTPTQFLIEQWGYTWPHGVAFDPRQLHEALFAGDNMRATAIIHGDSPLPSPEKVKKLFLWVAPSPKLGAVLANAPSAGSALPSVAIDQLVVRIESKVDAHTPSKDVITFDNNLVKLLKVEFDGIPGVRSGTNVLGEFPLTFTKKAEFDLNIWIPHGSSGESLVVADTIKFTASGGKWAMDTKTLDARLTVLAATGKTPTNTIWTVSLDPSFFRVTARTRDLNKDFELLSPSKGRLNDPGLTKATVQVLEDPRSDKTSPVTYTMLYPSTAAGKGELINVFLFFQNEDDAPPDAEHHRFREASILLGPPWFVPSSPPGSKAVFTYRRGYYGSTTDYTPYPMWSWAYQMERAAADVLLVIPNVVPSWNGKTWVTAMGFGDLADPAAGVRRVEKLLWARWADSDAKQRTKVPPKLGKLIIGGWSSGMRTVFDWLHGDSANRVDAIFCFDAIGAASGTKYAFPGGWDWRAWLDKKEGRKLAFLNGQYSQPSAIEAADYLGKNGYAARMLLHEPKDAAYWYDQADFKAAHHGMTFPALPPTGASANAVYVKREIGKKLWKSYKLVLCHGSDPEKTEQTVDNVSIHEAADIMHHELGMPVSPKAPAFAKAVGDLKVTGSPSEKDRAALERHTWSCSGGKNVDGDFEGYLELTLKAAISAGLLPKL